MGDLRAGLITWHFDAQRVPAGRRAVVGCAGGGIKAEVYSARIFSAILRKVSAMVSASRRK